ncbi:MAG TPA: universal stress protein [Desulfopila sp.]|nr:universal stress protein [Desulfopila sp.]
MNITSILWPSDGSQPSYKALDAAIELARKFKARIYALQVVHQVPTITGAGFAPVAIQGFDVPLYEQELMKTAEKELHQTVTDKVPGEIEVTARVKVGIPAETITDFARENNISMIVMATQGRTGITHFMLGSVAEKTIRQSTIPTLIIPAPDEEQG